MIAEHRQTAYKTMTEIAITEITNAILSGKYKPGSRVVPSQLEEEFRIGRAAIRDAIREITGTGLLINLPNKGTLVASPLTLEEMEDIFTIRYHLEGKAVYKAALEMSTESIDKLEAYSKKMKKVTTSPSLEFFLLNKEFHLLLCEKSEWTFLSKIIDQCWTQIQLCRITYPFDPRDIESYVDDHDEIIDAIKSRDPVKTQQKLVAHLKSACRDLLKMHKQQRNLSAVRRD